MISCGVMTRTIDPLDLVHLGSPAHGPQRGIGVGQRHVPPLGEHDVKIKVLRQVFIQLHALIVEQESLPGSGSWSVQSLYSGHFRHHQYTAYPIRPHW